MGLEKKPLSVHFGRRLQICRGRAEISQEELGFRTSLHRTEIGLLERGEREPQLSTIIKLAGAMEAPLHELIGEVGWKPVSEDTGEFEFRNLRDVPAE